MSDEQIGHAHMDEDVPPPNARCTIKGNSSGNGAGRQYFLSTCKNYEQIKVTPSADEQYFCSEAEAKKAGFTKAGTCGE
jgi:hypothetical protein